MAVVGAGRAAENVAGPDGRAVGARVPHALPRARVRHLQHRDDRRSVFTRAAIHLPCMVLRGVSCVYVCVCVCVCV